MTEKHNGWSNRETWAASLHLANDEQLCHEVDSVVQEWRKQAGDIDELADRLGVSGPGCTPHFSGTERTMLRWFLMWVRFGVSTGKRSPRHGRVIEPRCTRRPTGHRRRMVTVATSVCRRWLRRLKTFGALVRTYVQTDSAVIREKTAH